MVAVALGSVTPSRAGTQQSTDSIAAEEAASAEVVVDASEVGTMPRRIVLDVAAKATRAMADAGLPPGAARLTFVEVDPMIVLRGVRVSLVTDAVNLEDPEGDPRGRLLASCTACSDAELAGLAIEAILEAIELHEDAVEARRVEADAAAASAAPGPSAPEPAPLPADEPRRRPGPLGWAGIGGLSLGVGAVVAGAVLASQPPMPYPGEPRMDVLRDLRPPGYAMLGLGGAFVVAGAVMLVVDRRRAHRKPVAHRPTLRPTPLGVAVTLPW